MECYGCDWNPFLSRMPDWFQPQSYCRPLPEQHQSIQPQLTSYFQQPLLTPCRLSRIDNWCYEHEPRPFTLFRQHSVQRIRSPSSIGNCCFKRTSSTRQLPTTNDIACLSPPIILKNCQRPVTPPNKLRNHLSRSSSCQSLSPSRRSSCNRSVRFGSCTSIDDAGCERILYARSSQPECPIEVPRTSSCSRNSSVVRVISRSCSPCATFITAELPSRAASATVCCVDAGNQTKPMVSVGSCCNLGPVCKPKPKGNLKYRCVFEKEECTPPPLPFNSECFPLPPPPPASSCCVTDEDVKLCTCPEVCPPKFERYESTYRVERVTRSNVSHRSICRIQSTERAKEVREVFESCDELTTRYLKLIERKEEELNKKIADCEMDIAACEYMMNSAVSALLREAIQKGRELIRCEFRDVRKICDSKWVSGCYNDGNDDKHDLKMRLEHAWNTAQTKMHKVSELMDRVDTLRFNGWQS